MILLTDTIMIRWRVLFLLIIHLVLQQSDAAFVDFSRKLSRANKSRTKSTQISPSPTPVSAPADPPKVAKLDDEDACDKVQLKCRDYVSNMTACLLPAANGGSILHIHNDGQRYLKLNVTILPVNQTYDNVGIPKHEQKKINISSNIGVSSSIILNDGGNSNCVINLGASVPLEILFGQYATPTNTAYLLAGTIVLIGGTWACCRMREKRRHLDGVPYQELEMEQQQQLSLPYSGEETAESWDRSWDDDDWDEEKAVRSPGRKRLRRLGNGVTSRTSETEEWDSD